MVYDAGKVAPWFMTVEAHELQAFTVTVKKGV